MVPLLALVLLPLVAAGGHEGGGMDMNQMMQMMQMMQQNNNGWGMQQAPAQQQQQNNWWGMEKQEDYEAYLKWCEENKARQAEQAKQKELLDMYEKQEAERKMQMEKERVRHEAEERHESMMAQWKMWQKRLEMQHEFDGLAYAMMEMKHKYMYMVTMEFLKFCKCSDWSNELARYFQHDGLDYNTDEYELDDLQGVDSDNPTEVARAIANLPKEDQIKIFFGGLATSMCAGGKVYVDQVMAWEKEFNFLDRLM